MIRNWYSHAPSTSCSCLISISLIAALTFCIAQGLFTCSFLFLCSGYYSYDAGFTPEFKGAERFKGQVVHPQQWGPDVDYAGKRVVVIGSGATAVTLVPALAKSGAAHVTMLQRSPTYMVSLAQSVQVIRRCDRLVSVVIP